MPLTERIQDAIQDTITPNTAEKIDGRAKLAEAGFSQEVIDDLGDDLINRFENALPIYERGVEGNLVLREALSLQHVEAGQATSEQLSSALESFIQAHPDSIIGSVRQTAEQQINSFKTQAEQTLTGEVENVLSQRPIIAWVANILNISASDITKYGINKVNGTATSFSLVGIAFMLLGFGKGNLFQDHVDSITNFVPNISLHEPSGELETPESPIPGGSQNETTEELVSIEDKKRASIDGGYIILSFMSGNGSVEQSNSLAVYEMLGEKTIAEIRKLYETIEYENGEIKPGEIERVFGISGSGDNEQEHYNTIRGMIGPYTHSFLNSIFVPKSNISQAILKKGSETEFSDAALSIFTHEELSRIQSSSGYESLQINQISRLTVLYCRNFYSNNTAHLQAAIGEVSTSVKDFIFGEEVRNVFLSISFDHEEEDLYPTSVAAVFANILTGDQYIHSNSHTLLNERPGFEEISDKDREKVDAIIIFRDQLTSIVPTHFSLGIPGFEARFLNRLDYGNVLALYTILGGKDLRNRSEMDDILIYTWIYNMFEGSDRGVFESAILESVSDESETLSDDQKNMLMVVLFRAIESSRNGFIDGAARIATLGHETVKNEILGNVPVSDRIKDYLAYALEAGGAYAVWKILSLFPTTRAVLFVTGGVTLGAILILSREGVYQGLSREMQKEFDSFLVANYGKYGDTGESIRGNIQSGDIGISDLMSGLENYVEGSLG